MDHKSHARCEHPRLAFCAPCNVAYCGNCSQQWYEATVNIPSIWTTTTSPTVAPFTVTSNGTAVTYSMTPDHTGH